MFTRINSPILNAILLSLKAWPQFPLNCMTNHAKKKKNNKFNINSLKSAPLKISKVKGVVLNRDMVIGRLAKIAKMEAIFKISDVLTLFNIYALKFHSRLKR
jgi:hypothetical protein